jgi:integrase/recombinase XerD
MEVSMGQLRDQMVMEMQLRNFSEKTIADYTRHIVWYTKYFGRSPAELGEAEIKQYLHHLLVEREVSWSYVNVAYSALQFLYEKTLNRCWNVAKIPRPKTGFILPDILSEQELPRLFDATNNFKHRMILMVTYAAGLRVSETAKLKLSHIDSDRLQIRVEQSKGRKDRYTLLSAPLLPELRRYYRQYRPQTYLFEGRKPGVPLSTETIQKVFKGAKESAGITKKATVHTLRHCFATHLMENGVDLLTIKKLMGHRSIQTTLRYVHVRHEHVRAVVSPLDKLLVK